MNYKDALKKLEKFRGLVETHQNNMFSSGPAAESLAKSVYEAYGEVEDIIERFAGKNHIEVHAAGQSRPSIYPNFIEAGYLSGNTDYVHEGYTQLLKIIGKVKSLSSDPTIPRDEKSLSSVIQILSRFRECCQYIRECPSNERDVQDIVWIMLRSHFDRVDREDTLPRFGSKKYCPDFGIPELSTLIEVKFIGEKTRVSDIQEGILADLPGYLNEHSRYQSVIIFVYDAAHKLRDSRKFIEDIRGVEGVVDVLVIPGIG